jgi:hypothetical protein
VASGLLRPRFLHFVGFGGFAIEAAEAYETEVAEVTKAFQYIESLAPIKRSVT